MAVTFVFKQNDSIVKAVSILDLPRMTIAVLQQCTDWIYKGPYREVSIDPINPEQVKFLQTSARIVDYDSMAVITQWLGGCPEGKPIDCLLPDD